MKYIFVDFFSRKLGEVILPQLLRSKVPVPVAAATSTGRVQSNGLYCLWPLLLILQEYDFVFTGVEVQSEILKSFFYSFIIVLDNLHYLEKYHYYYHFEIVVVALTCLACAEVQVSALVEAGGLSG